MAPIKCVVPASARRGVSPSAANLYYRITMRLLFAIFSACLAAHAQIPAQDARNVNLPNTDTHFAARTYRTRAEWQARTEFLRQQILSASGLLPLFPKNDLHPQIFGRIENRDYSIEKVLLDGVVRSEE